MAIPFANGVHCRQLESPKDENCNSVFKMVQDEPTNREGSVCPGTGTSATAHAAADEPGSCHVGAASQGRAGVSGNVLLRVTTCIIAGAVFGLSMEKGRVFEPLLIRNQMDFSCMVMLKMFVAAVAAVLFSMSALSVLPATRGMFQVARDNFICRLSAKGVTASSIGGALLGVGMTLGGACPGAVLVQIGAGVTSAVFTFLGCVLGATLYGLTEQTVANWTRPKNPMKNIRLDEIVGLAFWKVAIPLGIVLALFVYLLDVLVPWKSDLTVPNQSDASLFALRSWLPSVAGALIGCMQIPIVLAMGQTMGGSGSYCTMAAQLIPTELLSKISPYLLRTKYGLKNWWSIAYGCAAIVGAVVSASLSGSLGTTVGVPDVHAFLGGIVMVYGSRLAGGCTSGHGMSGMGTLCVFSFVAVPTMFLGGMGMLAMMKLSGVAN